jgi:hypothetical protein
MNTLSKREQIDSMEYTLKITVPLDLSGLLPSDMSCTKQGEQWRVRSSTKRTFLNQLGISCSDWMQAIDGLVQDALCRLD